MMKPLSTMLVVDDAQVLAGMCTVLDKAGQFDIDAVSSAKAALERLGASSYPLLYTDLNLSDMCGIRLIELAKQKSSRIHALIGSTTGSAGDVIAAMQAGAADFIIDPMDRDLVRHAFQKAARDVATLESNAAGERAPSRSVITQDKAMLGLLAMARKVAPSSATVLITGESGTGKELLASFVHAHSDRSDEPFVAINCAALPEQLAESELFGHEKGAFTGALSRKIGKFESAANGTLVLDEITEMSLPLQAKLLRALQEREIVRLGSNRPVKVHARVIAISNQNMKTAVAAGTFREDLFYRLNVIPLTIPPLRERKNDIPLLADFFLNHFSRQNASEMIRIDDNAQELLLKQSWPGNVRELENAIQRGVLIGSGDSLRPEHLILEETVSTDSPPSSIAAGMTVREMEKELIYNTLEAVNDNRTHAAKMLGISIRTLRNKLNEYRADMKATG
jgi:DNA-binding NtrC family response regulator